MLTIHLLISIFLIVLKVIEIESFVIEPNNNNLNICLTSTCVKEASVILNSIDESVSPCDNFYQFSCGKWLESTEIPGYKSSITRFSELKDLINKKLKGSLEKVSINSENRDYLIKAKNYYESCLNTTLIEKLGGKPLFKLLKQLGEWPLVMKTNWTEVEWSELYLRFRKLGIFHNMLFTLTVVTDLKNNSRRILVLDQPSLGLTRDNLLRGANDSSFYAYRKLIIKTAIKLGANKGSVNEIIDDMLSLERQLANFSMSKEERRNLTLIYNKMTIKELGQIANTTDWLNIIRTSVSDTIEEDEEIILYDINYIKYLDSLLAKTNKELLANYMIWRIIQTKLSSLSSDWNKLDKKFNSVVYGTKSSRPRPEKCLRDVENAMRISLSNVYIKNFFNEQNKQKALEMITNVKIQFKEALNSSDWMNGKTLEHALSKLENMKLLVGYPEELTNDSLISAYYEKLIINPMDYFGNKQNIYKWSIDTFFERLREPNNLYDWRGLSAVAEANAYYNQIRNMVIIPAGILQGIFFNKDRPNYLNYGTIAKSTGHEIIHAFDDTGRQYDENGNLNNWWDEKTDQIYRAKAQCIVDQYSNYTINEIGLRINGIYTLGENLADNGGIKHAFRAYLNSIKNTGPEQLLPGLKYTPEQLFWISYGVHYCAKQTNEYIKNLVQTDVHTPKVYRINGALSNSEDFSLSFNCPIGSAMNPSDKCSVW